MSTPNQAKHVPTPEEFIAMSESAEFTRLRKTFRGFAFPCTIAFLAWYIFYIVTATFATDFVQTKIYGAINLGMVLGLAQFFTAGVITWVYVRFADNKIDPATEAIRAAMENPQRNQEA